MKRGPEFGSPDKKYTWQYFSTRLGLFDDVLQKHPEIIRESFHSELVDYFAPYANRLINRLSKHRRAKGPETPLIIGVIAVQGARKTTDGEIMERVLKDMGYSAVSISIDDHYVTHEELCQIREKDPRFIRRGLTHDLELAERDFTTLETMREGDVVLIPGYHKGAHEGDGDRYRWVDLKSDTVLHGHVEIKTIMVNKQMRPVPVFHMDNLFYKGKGVPLPENMGSDIPLLENYLPNRVLELLTRNVDLGQPVSISYDVIKGEPQAVFRVEKGGERVNRRKATLAAIEENNRYLEAASEAFQKDNTPLGKELLEQARYAIEASELFNRGNPLQGAHLAHGPMDIGFFETAKAYLHYLSDFKTALEIVSKIKHEEEHEMAWNWIIPLALKNRVPSVTLVQYVRDIKTTPLFEKVLTYYRRERKDRKSDMIIFATIEELERHANQTFIGEEGLRYQKNLKKRIQRLKGLSSYKKIGKKEKSSTQYDFVPREATEIYVPLKQMPTGWKIIDEKPDFIFYEGWMVGASPVEDESVFDSGLPGLKRKKAREFAREGNRKLAQYLPLWKHINYQHVIHVPDYKISIEWRNQQEEPLRAKGKAMNSQEIRAFVYFFWRSGVHPEIHIERMVQDPTTDQVTVLGNDRSIITVVTRDRTAVSKAA